LLSCWKPHVVKKTSTDVAQLHIQMKWARQNILSANELKARNTMLLFIKPKSLYNMKFEVMLRDDGFRFNKTVIIVKLQTTEVFFNH